MINIYNKNFDKYANEHYKEIKSQIESSRRYTVAQLDAWFQSVNSQYTLESVITAKPDELVKIKNIYQSQPVTKAIKYLLNMYNTRFSNRGTFIGSDYNAVKMTKKLDIRVCPLCNRNHIGNVDLQNRGAKRTCQLDHFHNKSKYPFLAMSFYNLIPVCPSCNHIKGTQDIAASPYDENVNFNDLMRFEFSLNSIQGLSNKDDISVSLVTDPSIQENTTVLGLDKLYETHNDTAFELMNTHRVYSELMRDELFKSFPSLFKSKDEIKNIVFGSYLEEANHKKQVLSKLKNDIFKQLETQIHS